MDADGITSGPKSFSGPIGKSLQENLTDFEVVQFAKVPYRISHVMLGIMQMT